MDRKQIQSLNHITMRICTDSQSSIRSQSEGPTFQTAPLEACIWSLLLQVRQELGVTVLLHADVAGNERADVLAGLASTHAPQAEAPMDQKSAYAAIHRTQTKRWRERLYTGTSDTKNWHHSITQGHPVPRNLRNKQGGYQWTRQEERVLSQLRSNRCPLTRAYQHVIQSSRAQSLSRAQEKQQAERGRRRGRGRGRQGRGRGRACPPPAPSQ